MNPNIYFFLLFLCRSDYVTMISLCWDKNGTGDNLWVRHPAIHSCFRQTATLVCSDAQISLISATLLVILILYWSIRDYISQKVWYIYYKLSSFWPQSICGVDFCSGYHYVPAMLTLDTKKTQTTPYKKGWTETCA